MFDHGRYIPSGAEDKRKIEDLHIPDRRTYPPRAATPKRAANPPVSLTTAKPFSYFNF
jgi:hypothetical protein